MFLETEKRPQGEPFRESSQETITKLSQAIRVGAMLRHQCTGDIFKGGGSCALGAAYEAIFGHPGRDVTLPDDQASHLERLWGVIPSPKGLSPVMDIGMNRNDSGWTRERIADWLESQGY